MERLKEYTVAPLEATSQTPEAIISGILDDEIKARMIKVIKIEAPIRQSLLYKRTINSFSLQKVGSRILQKFDEIATSLDFDYIEENGEKVYIFGESQFFRPTPDSEVRYSYQIPYIEGANCILHILESRDKSSYTQKELSYIFAETMGYQKLGAKVLELFKESLKDQRIKKNKNGRVQK
ncbi:MAG: DUF3320 domain-containing protein [Spirochaetales bacterium]|nr:DUF3320 domain-containing protein [Spirochaetales bacterium]